MLIRETHTSLDAGHAAGRGFIEADVLDWKEGVRESRSRKPNARAAMIGDRMMTAEVLKDFGNGKAGTLAQERR